MGGFGSSRWKNHLKRICVEECGRERAQFCPLCSRPVVWVFTVPNRFRWIRAVACLGPGCRACLRLTYRSRQSWATRAAEIAKDPAARGALDAEIARQSATFTFDTETPPEGLGRRALGRWFRERDAAQRNFARLIELQNSLPSALPTPVTSPVPDASGWLQSGFLDELRRAAQSREKGIESAFVAMREKQT